MARFVETEEILQLLKSAPDPRTLEQIDDVCSPAHLFLAVGRARASDDDTVRLSVEENIRTKSGRFFQALTHGSLLVVDIGPDDLGYLLQPEQTKEFYLLNHFESSGAPPEETVSQLCRQIVNRMGW